MMRDPMVGALSCLACFACLACTTVEQTRFSSSTPKAWRGSVFATQEDVANPYVSMGPIQATRRGIVLFGFLDPAGTDLQTILDDDLFPAVRKLGGEGVINVRYVRTQYTLAQRFLFFLVPLPTEVTVTGEVVRIIPASQPAHERSAAVAPQAPR